MQHHNRRKSDKLIIPLVVISMIIGGLIGWFSHIASTKNIDKVSMVDPQVEAVISLGKQLDDNEILAMDGTPEELSGRFSVKIMKINGKVHDLICDHRTGSELLYSDRGGYIKISDECYNN